MSSRRWRPHRPGRCVRGRCPREARQSCERLTARAPSPLRSGRRRRERTEPTRGEGSPRGKPGPSSVTCSSTAWSRSTATSSTRERVWRSAFATRLSRAWAIRHVRTAQSELLLLSSGQRHQVRDDPGQPSVSSTAEPIAVCSSSRAGRSRAIQLELGPRSQAGFEAHGWRRRRTCTRAAGDAIGQGIARGLTPVPAHTLASRSRRQV